MKAHQDCKLLGVQGTFEQHRGGGGGFALQKNSPHLLVSNFFIGRLLENGSHFRLAGRPSYRFSLGPDLSGKPLGISTCFTAFIVLFFGASISIILLMTEVATKILKRRIYG